ncbi:MAG: phosphoribosyl-AMP cyclohydrolase [Gammaproteobacteria bacterium]|nr:phosphoribosyl-AMP cyclohydrolase [Gammaproteobacteria bacterium]MDE0680752.1 phosphoribosyl-AMP cyclohydrolase [Gammaproteobacteria bacterium]MXW45894.1 phosphoribosyl-AMP cyclohydrolase [Gammaproteobacteria bacterium]MYD00762.1 phosphoribosyl-AMP cyclohydrolase [Gammaproteobacteria bacterium]MYI25450.1 phosphoribosyl-AMP cyclohydrolase [Gammaproteobacteria bacterium]
MSELFAPRRTVVQVEESAELAPKFDANGLIPAVVTDHGSGELLMHAYMNREALELTITTGEAHYFSRSRNKLWRKGETSGLKQRVRELLIDDDQDCVWLRVELTGGASCHVGYRSCFYRRVPLTAGGGPVELEFTESDKVFDPEQVYAGQENPTRL